MRHPKCSVSFVLLLLAASTHAGETLEYALTEGFTYSFEQSNQTTSVIDAQSGFDTMTVEQRYEQALNGTVTVLESARGVPTRMRVRFDPESGGSTTVVGGQTQRAPFALAGQTVEVEIANERIAGVTGSNGRPVVLGPEQMDQLADIVVFERAVLPGREVDVGDTWVVDLSREDRPLSPNLELRVVRFEDRQGRRIAELSAEGTIAGTQDGIRTEGSLTGPLFVDVQTGLPIESRLTGSLNFDGSMQQGGVSTKMQGSHYVVLTARARTGGAVSAAPSSTGSAAGAGRDWQEFRHSSGATLSHPKDWRVVEVQNGIQIWPPDAGSSEMIVATGVPTNGTTDPSAPDVAAYLDASIFQMLPGMSRTGAPTAVKALKGPGALYKYTGASFDGNPVASRIYVTIENGVALSLSAVAPPGVLESRAETLAGIFSTLALGSAATASSPGAAPSTGSTPTGDDGRLVGMFAGESIASGSGVYVNTQLVYVLNADGTLYYGAQSHFNASERDHNGNLRWSATGNSDGNVESGRWSARNGMLSIRWDSGQQSRFAYGFEPDGSLVLRDPNTRKLINFYSRVR